MRSTKSPKDGFKDVELGRIKQFNWKRHIKIALVLLAMFITLFIEGGSFNVIGLVILCIVTISWLVYIYLKLKKGRNIVEERLHYFIHSNNLWEKQGNKITSYIRLAYYEAEDTLTVRIYKLADIYQQRANRYDEALQALFCLPLENKHDTIQYCDYIFKKERDKRLVVSSQDEIIYNNTTILPLNNNLNWNILKQPHALVAGVTGGGKSTFIFYLIIEFLKMKSTLFICDPKKSDLGSLKHVIGEEFVATEPNHISRVIRQGKENMDKRYLMYKDNPDNFKFGASYVDYGLSPIILIFDELGAFRAGADKKVYAETMANLTEVILKGREMGVFAILSTQQPNSQNIPTELRENLSMRIALGNMGNEGYRMVFGESNNNMQSISSVGGAYIYLDGLGWDSPKQFEAPFVDYKNFDLIAEIKKMYKQNVIV